MKLRGKLTRRARQAGLLVRHVFVHRSLRHRLRNATRSGHASKTRGASYKFLGSYLSHAFSPRDRLQSLVHHYRFLEQAIAGGAAARRWSGGVAIWQRLDETGHQHRVILQQARFAPMEGEAELAYMSGDRRIYVLTFAIVDGALLGEPAAPVLFVGGLQGGYRSREDVRAAARINGEIAPATMLLIALRALADVFEIATIAATPNSQQVARDYLVDGRSTSLDYDLLWEQLGGRRNAHGAFVSPVMDEPGPDDPISGNHRSRTRRRRQLRTQLRHEVRTAIVASLRRAAPMPAAAVLPDAGLVAIAG